MRQAELASNALSDKTSKTFVEAPQAYLWQLLIFRNQAELSEPTTSLSESSIDLLLTVLPHGFLLVGIG